MTFSLLSRPLGLRSLVRPRSISLWSLRRLSTMQLPLQQSLHQSHVQSNSVISIRKPQVLKTQQSIRSFHSLNSVLRRYFDGQPPRFNRGPPSTFGFLYYLIPESLKAFLVIMGASAFILFFMGPLLIITVPPLVIGGFLLTKWARYKNKTDLQKRYEQLLETHLTYEGSEFDGERIGDFVLDRIIKAAKTNESEILDSLKLRNNRFRDHRSNIALESRLELTHLNSFDQNFTINSRSGIQEQITVTSFGLLDALRDDSRIATVIVTLRPKTLRSLLQIDESSSYDAVIEIRPVSLTGQPITLLTPSEFKEPPTINIRPNR